MIFIIKVPTDVQLALLRGLWLGDGHVGKQVKFGNTDPRLIETVSALLSIHETKYSIHGSAT